MSGPTQNEVDVTISCLCYNHEHYIRKALDSFLAQETEYSYEIVVHDDASTDGSQEILREYEERYPSQVRVIYQQENQSSKKHAAGITGTFIFPISKGRYIAFCDGDDYWTDLSKLDKQVSFLEGNSEYSLCYHNYETLSGVELTPHSNQGMRDMELADYAQTLVGVQTLTVLARNIFRDLSVPKEILRHRTGSYFWYLILAGHGKFKYMDEVMAVYRKHGGGIWTGKSKAAQGRMSLSNKYAMILYFADNREVCNILKDVYVKIASYYWMSLLRSLDLAAAWYFLRLSLRFGVRRVHFVDLPLSVLKKAKLLKS